MDVLVEGTPTLRLKGCLTELARPRVCVTLGCLGVTLGPFGSWTGASVRKVSVLSTGVACVRFRVQEFLDEAFFVVGEQDLGPRPATDILDAVPTHVLLGDPLLVMVFLIGDQGLETDRTMPLGEGGALGLEVGLQPELWVLSLPHIKITFREFEDIDVDHTIYVLELVSYLSVP